MTAMAGQVDQEPAFVLHRRDFRETSLLLDVFTLHHGRVSLVARGANRPKNPWKAQLQPFQALLVGWQGRSDLKTLTDAEPRPSSSLFGTRRLYCGLYLNELLQRLLPSQDACPELFATYAQTLSSLAMANNVEIPLRRFERTLMDALGQGFSWELASDCGEPVQSGRVYCFDPEQGFTARPGYGTRLKHLSGDALLALANDDYDAPGARSVAKRVMRVLIDHLLQGRPLHSRELFTHSRGDNHEEEDPARG